MSMWGDFVKNNLPWPDIAGLAWFGPDAYLPLGDGRIVRVMPALSCPYDEKSASPTLRNARQCDGVVAKVIGGNGVLDEKTFRFNDYQLPKDQHGLFGKPSIHVRYDPHEETIGMQDEQAFDSAAMMRDIDAYITMFRLGRPRNAGVQEM